VNEQRYADWQTVEVEYVGSLQVPGDWVFTERNGVIYFTDREFDDSDPLEDVTLYMFLAWPNIETWEVWYHDAVSSNTFFESIKFVRNINRSLVYAPPIFGSPIGGHGNTIYEIDGEEKTRMEIDISAVNAWLDNSRTSLHFIVWDESVSEATARRIVRSYRRE